jgi:hypothetical protein
MPPSSDMIKMVFRPSGIGGQGSYTCHFSFVLVTSTTKIQVVVHLKSLKSFPPAVLETKAKDHNDALAALNTLLGSRSQRI